MKSRGMTLLIIKCVGNIILLCGILELYVKLKFFGLTLEAERGCEWL